MYVTMFLFLCTADTGVTQQNLLWKRVTFGISVSSKLSESKSTLLREFEGQRRPEWNFLWRYVVICLGDIVGR